MLNAIQQGILTNSTKERLEELESCGKILKASILQAELERPKYSREDIIEWISRFKYGDPSNKEYQRQIIDIFLNSIYVFDDRLVFTYNYKIGTQTVSLADVSAAFGSDLKSCTPPRKSEVTRFGFFHCAEGGWSAIQANKTQRFDPVSLHQGNPKLRASDFFIARRQLERYSGKQNTAVRSRSLHQEKIDIREVRVATIKIEKDGPAALPAEGKELA